MGDVEVPPLKSKLDSLISEDITLPGGQLSKEIFSAVKEQQKTGKYCDVTVKVGGKNIQAHRNILSAFSPFFAARISEDPSESELEINWITADIFEIILDYAYSSSITISGSNAAYLLRAASRLAISSLTKACAKYLVNVASMNYLTELYELATEVSCADLAEFVDKYVKENFTKICGQETFLEMKPEQLINIIKCDDLTIREEIVFNSVIKWVNHKEERHCMLPKIMTYVRLALLSPEFLRKRCQEEEVIRTSPICMQWISEIMLFKLHLGISEPQQNFMKPRLESLATKDMLIFGSTNGGKSGMIGYSLDPESVSIYNYPDTLSNARTRMFHVASAVSGESAFVLAENYKLVRYDFSANTWIDIGLETSLSHADLVWLDGFLYATNNIRNGDTEEDLATSKPPKMKRLDTKTNVWYYMSKMPSPRWDCNLVVVKNMIYVIGGSAYKEPGEWTNVVRGPIYVLLKKDDVRDSNDVQCYNPRTNTWTVRSSMPAGHFPLVPNGNRRKLLCCAFQGKIYVIDGTENDNGVLTKMLVYNIAQDSWTKGADLHQAYMRPVALMVLNGKLTFIDASSLPYLQIEIFSPAANTWEIYEKKVNLVNLKQCYCFVKLPFRTYCV